jgi:hypothetical protein
VIAYEFYCRDEIDGIHFIGLLPERRENPARITQESIMNWGKEVIGKEIEAKEIFFSQVAIK